MNELIPPLRDLCFARNGYAVPAEFAVSYVRLHDDKWTEAEEHWERLVTQLLDSTAVRPRASPREAMRQAVTAAKVLLYETPLRDRCPYCPASGERRCT